jgi:hypothetical protein
MSRLGPVLSSAGRKPGTPTIGTATAGNSQATVTFTAPTYLGKPNSSLTYTVVSSPSSISQTGSGSPIVVTGLSNGTAYTFTVKLSNTVLDSDFSSSSNQVTPTSPTPVPVPVPVAPTPVPVPTPTPVTPTPTPTPVPVTPTPVPVPVPTPTPVAPTPQPCAIAGIGCQNVFGNCYFDGVYTSGPTDYSCVCTSTTFLFCL